jgi:hypothetical protein
VKICCSCPRPVLARSCRSGMSAFTVSIRGKGDISQRQPNNRGACRRGRTRDGKALSWRRPRSPRAPSAPWPGGHDCRSARMTLNRHERANLWHRSTRPNAQERRPTDARVSSAAAATLSPVPSQSQWAGDFFGRCGSLFSHFIDRERLPSVRPVPPARMLERRALVVAADGAAGAAAQSVARCACTPSDDERSRGRR